MCKPYRLEVCDGASLPGEGPAACIRPRARLHTPAAARDRRDRPEDAAIRRHFPHPPRCALERRRSRHSAGLRLHPRRDRQASPPRLSGPAPPRSIGQAFRREVRESRPSLAHGRMAGLLPRHLAIARPQGQNLAEIWRDGITNPRTGAPIGNGPFLLSSWERGKEMILVRNPRYWGPHTAYVDRIVISFCQSCPLLPTPSRGARGPQAARFRHDVHA